MSRYRDRGMKKWQPFASLIEYNDYYDEMLVKRQKKEKPELSSDQKEEINEVLENARPGTVLSVRYYIDGFVRQKDGELLKVDVTTHSLILDNLVVPFANLLGLSVEERSKA